ncbi:thiamine pyrophosphate-binding protein [Pseudonocardia sp. ICBG1293]|uniref:thiamine pyrophosphate-binding protein n=1 Tax=Pseudonocardia sp. ICBG1293 TaxID=2844382 RepID=UPI001CC92768|nr:thiamine pyrophosphate-binding protein [Pseudonocardia sp. ICBG1293]
MSAAGTVGDTPGQAAGDVVQGAWPAVLAELAAAGVGTVFGLPSDDVAMLRAAAGPAPAAPHLVVCRDQRAAGYMAVGHAQAAGTTGVVVVGKGPAVTTVSTAVLEASASRTPLLVLATGTAPEHRDTGAFQELDQVAVLGPLVRRAIRVETPARLVPALRQALWTATGPVPGPVYLEIPEHLLDALVPVPPGDGPSIEEATAGPLPEGSRAGRLLAGAQRPLILAGGGARGAAPEVLALAEALDAPVFLTASGRGRIDEEHPHVVGLSGLYCHAEVVALWAEADLVVALGSRLEETATIGWPDAIGTTVPVLQVNRAAAEFSAGHGGHRVVGDVAAVARGWAACAGPDRGPWRRRGEVCRAAALAAGTEQATTPGAGVRPARVADALAAVAAHTPDDRVLVAENGLADMLTYHWPAYVCRGGGGWVAPSEQTPLGFGAAAAVGVKRAVGERCVVAVVGDGAFTLVDADLPTAADHGLGVLYVVVDNGGYGWLESQRRPGDGIPAGIFARAGRDLPGSPDPRVRLFGVTEAAQVGPAVAEAYAETRAGRVAVVWVRVGLDDGPHAGAPLDGDVPVLPG